MDGHQRLEAIKDFLENVYALRGMEYWPELDGYRFAELPPTIQRGLLRRTVSAIVLLAETSRPGDSDIDVRMALFKRLNTGGILTWPSIEQMEKYIEFCEILARALTKVGGVYAVTLPTRSGNAQHGAPADV